MLNQILAFAKDFLLFVGYVSKGGSFPKPLNGEDEKKYIELMNDGDVNAKNLLIEHNLRLVAHIIKKYNTCGIENDDLISIGTIGLIKGISTFSSGKNTQLVTYVARCIENEILMSIRSIKKTKSEVSLNEPIGIDKDGNEIAFVDVIGTMQESVHDQVELKVEITKMFELIKSKLTPREKLVIEMRFGLNNGKIKTQKEISKILGISRSYVSRIEKKALIKLNKELEKKK